MSYQVELRRFWPTLDHLRGTVDVSKVGILALALIFVRASREADWAAWRASGGLEVDVLLRNLPHEISGEVAVTLRTLGDLSAPPLAQMIDVLDSVARRLGNAATFQLLLEGLVAREGFRRRAIHTPESVTGILTSVINMSSASTVYDPFCRTGELLVAAAARARAESSSASPSVHGAMPDSESLGIARMNIQVSGVRGELERRNIAELADGPMGNSRFSRILTSPPFNLGSWTDHDSPHWRYGPPPKSNANYAWLQHVVERLEPGGQAAVVMPNGALFSSHPRERDIRMRMVEDGCVEALISLPPGLFYYTAVPVTIWLMRPPGSAREEILFIDASSSGHMASRTHREIDDTERNEIIWAVDAWRSGRPVESSISVLSVPLSQVRERDYNLSPSVYLSPPPAADDHETAISAIRDLMQRLAAQQDEAVEKDTSVLRILKDLMA
jgi:type I restriction enzyme M protein